MSNSIKAASIEVSSFQSMNMDKQELERIVIKTLQDTIFNELTNNMTVKTNYNPQTDSTVYTAIINTDSTFPISSHYRSPTSPTISGFNGTISNMAERAQDLRVVEFTKNGKITRVELQRKTENGWTKIPRIQIEE